TPSSTGTAFGSAVSNGGTAACYDRGSTANATLSSGAVVEGGIAYTFTNWSGDASGSGLTSSNITMSAARTATANWATDSIGPVTSSVVASPSPTSTPPTVTASVSDATTGGSNVAGAEDFIGSVGS